jgi:FlaA1/EpsC-like NDP-sugar epimerase
MPVLFIHYLYPKNRVKINSLYFRKNMELTPIQEFYKGRSVLITGATGFCGKSLLEKLLRSCSDVGKIYLLVRPKKNEDISTRFKKVFDDPVRKITFATNKGYRISMLLA